MDSTWHMNEDWL